MKTGTLGFIVGAIIAWSTSKILPYAIFGVTVGVGYAVARFVLSFIHNGYCTF